MFAQEQAAIDVYGAVDTQLPSELQKLSDSIEKLEATRFRLARGQGTPIVERPGGALSSPKTFIHPPSSTSDAIQSENDDSFSNANIGLHAQASKSGKGYIPEIADLIRSRSLVHSPTTIHLARHAEMPPFHGTEEVLSFSLFGALKSVWQLMGCCRRGEVDEDRMCGGFEKIENYLCRDFAACLADLSRIGGTGKISSTVTACHSFLKVLKGLQESVGLVIDANSYAETTALDDLREATGVRGTRCNQSYMFFGDDGILIFRPLVDDIQEGGNPAPQAANDGHDDVRMEDTGADGSPPRAVTTDMPHAQVTRATSNGDKETDHQTDHLQGTAIILNMSNEKLPNGDLKTQLFQMKRDDAKDKAAGGNPKDGAKNKSTTPTTLFQTDHQDSAPLQAIALTLNV
ncbi:unnamed protein product, partial [Mesorhabditis spiculigera]